MDRPKLDDSGRSTESAEAEVSLAGAAFQDRGLVVVGDTVRRPAGRWTGSVHHLLRFLRARGITAAPEPLGIDGQGREVLRYIAGRDQEWPLHADLLSTAGAEALGRLAARLQDALRAYECPLDAEWQFGSGAPVHGQCIQHGDLGPWNLLWGDGPQVVGILDWDFAGPNDPTYDLGHLAWFTIPLMDDERARSRGFPVAPDRRARLEAFAEGAGLTPSVVMMAGVQAQRAYEQMVVERARSESGQWSVFYEHGFHENAAADRGWTFEHLIR